MAEKGRTAPIIPKGPHKSWAVPERYEVRRIIGQGSYGSVCEAYDSGRGGIVAIKRVKHMFDDLIDCKRILRELAILTRLSHPHIVQIYDIVEPPDLASFDELYIVMEICDSDLKKLIKSDVTLLSAHINTLLYNLLVGLKYLHSAGIYHRDLKPANCLCNQDCSVKICDFGLARAIGESQPHLQELPNTPRESQDVPESSSGPVVPSTMKAKRCMTQHVVTRWYRAPELILLQENYCEAIDVWSVGCIYAELLQMLEGINFQDRGPLFPGSTCFPLSPHKNHRHDYKFHTRGSQDQLNMIFDLLGTPTDEETDELERDDAKRYIKCFAKRDGEGFKSKFPMVEDPSVHALEKMLTFSQRRRARVDELLDSPLLDKYRVPAKEITAPGYVSLEFEKEPDLDDQQLRVYFGEEIGKFRVASL